MVNSTDEKISPLIQKLGDLKKAKNRHQAERLKLHWSQIEPKNALWSRDVQPTIDEIEIDLVELWDCILENTEWNKAGIENAIKSRKPDLMDALIQEFKVIRRGLEIKSQQHRKQTKQKTTPAKDLSKELEKLEVGTQAYPGPRRQVPTSDADRQRAFLGGYTVGEYKYAPDLPRGETATKQNTTPAKEEVEKAKSTTSPAGLLKYLNVVLDDIERLEGSRKFKPYVDKYIRTELATAYHETKKAVEKIRAQNPAIKETPADSNDPREYLHNVHTWCIGLLYWENGERMGAEAEQDTTRAKLRRIWNCLKRIPRWIYVLVIFLAALIYILRWLWTIFWPE